MTTYLKSPSPEQDAQLADWATKFETAYPDFYKIPDIVLALEKAQKAGVPINALKADIGFDLRDRKRMNDYSVTMRTPPTVEVQKKARKSLKTVESVIAEIGGLREQFEEAMQRAISDLKDFPTDHINSEEYLGAFSSFLADAPANPDVPLMNGQKILGALSIEQGTSASLYLLDKIREALIVTSNPKESPALAIMKRDSEGIREFPKERRGVKADHFVQGTILKYADFFREATGSPQDGIARLIVGHLVAPVRPKKMKWLNNNRKDGVTPTELYKQAREAAEKSSNRWPARTGALTMLETYRKHKQQLEKKAAPFLKKRERPALP